MKYGITGFRSSIAQNFIELTDNTGVMVYQQSVEYHRDADALPLNLDRYLLCAGVLHGKTMTDMTEQQMWESMRVNYLETVSLCDSIFDANVNARVCIIGSMSGFNGSFDMAYAGAKAAMHMYVETKKLEYAGQHLVAVSPTIIADSGMTKRRNDYYETMLKGSKRRLKRWLDTREVAEACMFALNNQAVCNTVIKLTGGNW